MTHPLRTHATLFFQLGWRHCDHMRILLPLALISLSCTAPTAAEDALGIWKVRPDQSTGPYFGIVRLRFEKHAEGEVFTLDMVDRQGRFTTTSTILYFDGKPRDFQDSACSGTQSSRRLDRKTVEILRNCLDGHFIRLVRRFTGEPRELALEITDQKPGGDHQEGRLVLKRQTAGAATQ